MTIGRLAKAAGINVETIRYYQRRGLIAEPDKPLGGQRSYAEPAIARITFIRRAQQFGFTLAEVKDLLQFADADDVKAVRRVAEKRYSSLTLQSTQLGAMRRRLKRLIDKSRRLNGSQVDPIIAALRISSVM